MYKLLALFFVVSVLGQAFASPDNEERELLRRKRLLGLLGGNGLQLPLDLGGLTGGLTNTVGGLTGGLTQGLGLGGVLPGGGRRRRDADFDADA